jgi:hypothetical protein
MLGGLSGHAVRAFPVIIGSLAILLALLSSQLSRAIGLKPLSQVFSTPQFQHSAAITETLGRIVLGLLGIGFLVQGLGPRFLSARATLSISLVVLALCGATVVAIVGVTLAHWNA